MKTLLITRKDFVEKEGVLTYEKDLVFDGDVQIEGGLGRVRFAFGIAAAGRVWAEAGTGIMAGGHIMADRGIITYRAGIRAQTVRGQYIAAGLYPTAPADIESEVHGKVLCGNVKPPNPLPPAEYAWHLHHDILVERLTEPIEDRLAYIKENKSPDEAPTRLRLLKKVQDVKALYRAMDQSHEAIEELHRRECDDCPWDGHTIFPRKTGQP